MAVVGACEGAIVGPIYAVAAFSTAQGTSLSIYVSPRAVPSVGMQLGAIYAGCIGFIAGGLSFLIAGVISCTTRSPGKLFKGVLRSAAIATALGVILGAVAGSLNAWLWNMAIQHSASLRGWPISGAIGEQGPSAGLFWGVIIGFILATFWGGVTGALCEARRMQVARERDPASETDSEEFSLGHTEII